MKRIAVIAVAAALFATTGAVAIASETETDAETSETRVLTEAQLWRTTLLASYLFDRFSSNITTVEEINITTVEEIIGLRTGDTPIGWGAMFRLLQLAEAEEMSLSVLLTGIAEDEDVQGWAFGKRFKDLGWDPSISSSDDETPKNFGQLMKQKRGPGGNQGQNP